MRPWRASLPLPRKRAAIIGVKVSAKVPEISIATVTVTANSRNNRPTMPPISKSGMNTATSERLIETMVKPISPTIIQRKTGRPVQFEITEQTRASLQDWLNARPADRGPYVIPSRVHNQPHVTARQYARVVHGWIEGAGMDSSAYGTHSMRRTKAAQIYRKTGNLRAVQLLLGHTTIESTVRYLGIEVHDALTLSDKSSSTNGVASRGGSQTCPRGGLPATRTLDPLLPLLVVPGKEANRQKAAVQAVRDE
jgi:Phage integrase family